MNDPWFWFGVLVSFVLGRFLAPVLRKRHGPTKGFWLLLPYRLVGNTVIIWAVRFIAILFRKAHV